MGCTTTPFLVPTKLKQHPSSLVLKRTTFLLEKQPRGKRAIVPVARLFGPAIFEGSKLKVSFLGVDKDKHPGKLPRTYTLTHCDITAKLTLVIYRA